MSETPFSLTDPSACEGPLHPQAAEGLRLFNAGQYFEAHEALETAWKDEAGPIRELYRGVLQVAVGYLHITRGNYTGALKMFRRCRPWLEPFPEWCRGIAVGQLKRDYQAVESELRRLGPEGLQRLNPSLLKPVIWVDNEGSEN
jgi:predicted metal-dependent hydrolase